MSGQLRCPGCDRFGSAKLDGYCKNCYPGAPPPEKVEESVCVQCGKPAFRRNEEYEGCPDDWYCREHWEERNGAWLHGAVSDWKSIKAPPCEQCGKPAFKRDKNGFPYCKPHWIARQKTEVGDINFFSGEYQDDTPVDSTIPDSYGMVKDKFGYAR